MPMHYDHSLSADQDCIDQFAGSGHLPAYGSTASVDQLRRDGTLAQHGPSAASFTATNGSYGSRFLPERGLVTDGNRCVLRFSTG